MNTKLILIIMFGVLLVSATVLTHDIEAKKSKKKCKVSNFEDGSKGKMCIGDKVVWYENNNGSRGKKHTCIVADFNGHCTTKGLYYDFSLYKEDNNGKIIYPKGA
jgi:hypothetical protein